MAFAVASKGAPLAGLLKKLRLAAPAAAALRPAGSVVVAPARRLFSTNATPFRRAADDDDYDRKEEEEEGYNYSGDEEEDGVYDRLRSRGFSVPSFFSPDVMFGEQMSLGGLLARMEAPRRDCWVSKEDADAVKLKVAMPGLGKEQVKVWADQDALVIKGEGGKDAEYDDDDEDPAWYGHHIQFPADGFKMDQIKAEMKDGVLRVTVPKIKFEEREDVIQVKVE